MGKVSRGRLFVLKKKTKKNSKRFVSRPFVENVVVVGQGAPNQKSDESQSQSPSAQCDQEQQQQQHGQNPHNWPVLLCCKQDKNQTKEISLFVAYSFLEIEDGAVTIIIGGHFFQEFDTFKEKRYLLGEVIGGTHQIRGAPPEITVDVENLLLMENGVGIVTKKDFIDFISRYTCSNCKKFRLSCQLCNCIECGNMNCADCMHSINVNDDLHCQQCFETSCIPRSTGFETNETNCRLVDSDYHCARCNSIQDFEFRTVRDLLFLEDGQFHPLFDGFLESVLSFINTTNQEDKERLSATFRSQFDVLSLVGLERMDQHIRCVVRRWSLFVYPLLLKNAGLRCHQKALKFLAIPYPST